MVASLKKSLYGFNKRFNQHIKRQNNLDSTNRGNSTNNNTNSTNSGSSNISNNVPVLIVNPSVTPTIDVSIINTIAEPSYLIAQCIQNYFIGYKTYSGTNVAIHNMIKSVYNSNNLNGWITLGPNPPPLSNWYIEMVSVYNIWFKDYYITYDTNNNPISINYGCHTFAQILAQPGNINPSTVSAAPPRETQYVNMPFLLTLPVQNNAKASFQWTLNNDQYNDPPAWWGSGIPYTETLPTQSDYNRANGPLYTGVGQNCYPCVDFPASEYTLVYTSPQVATFTNINVPLQKAPTSLILTDELSLSQLRSAYDNYQLSIYSVDTTYKMFSMLSVYGIWYYSGSPYTIEYNTPKFTCLVWFSKCQIKKITDPSSSSSLDFTTVFECAPFTFWNGYAPSNTTPPIEGQNTPNYQNNQWEFVSNAALTWTASASSPSFPTSIKQQYFQKIYTANLSNVEEKRSLLLDTQLIEFENLTLNYAVNFKNILHNINVLVANRKSLTTSEQESVVKSSIEAANYLNYVTYIQGFIILMKFFMNGIYISLKGQKIHITMMPNVQDTTGTTGPASMSIYNEPSTSSSDNSTSGSSNDPYVTMYIGNYKLNTTTSTTSSNNLYTPPYIESISYSFQMPVGNSSSGDVIYGSEKTFDITAYNSKGVCNFANATSFKLTNLIEKSYSGPINATKFPTQSTSTRGFFDDLYNDFIAPIEEVIKGAEELLKDAENYVVKSAETQFDDAISQIRNSGWNLLFITLGYSISYCPELFWPFILIDVACVMVGNTIGGSFGKALVGDATLVGSGHGVGELIAYFTEKEATEEIAEDVVDSIDANADDINITAGPDNNAFNEIVDGAASRESEFAEEADSRLSARSTEFARHDVSESTIEFRNTITSIKNSFGIDELGQIIDIIPAAS